MRSLMVGVSLVFTSCSFTKFAFTKCDRNQECRDAFGWGYVCAQDLCQEVAPIKRCERTYPSDLLNNVEGYRDRIVIGVQFDQSQFEVESLAAEFALEEAISASGLGDKKFAAVVCTNEASSAFDGLDQDQANVAVSEYLADQVGVAAIIGPASSDRVEEAFLAVEPFGTLVISPTATSPALTPLDGAVSTYSEPGLLWRTSPPDDIQGAALAELMRAEGVRTVAVIVEEGNYGTALGVIVKNTFEDDGGAATLVPFDSGSTASLLEKVAMVENMSVGGVVFISSDRGDTEAFLQVVASRSAGQGHDCSSEDDCPFRDDGAQIYLADGGKDLTLFENVDGIEGILERVRGTAPTHQQGYVYDVFAESFDAKRGAGSAASTPFTPYAYDAGWLVVHGAAWAHYNEATINGLGIARGLRQVSNKQAGTLDVEVGRIDWNAVKSEFQSAQPIDVEGASGTLDFDSETGETSGVIEEWCVRDLGTGLGFGTVFISEDQTSVCVPN